MKIWRLLLFAAALMWELRPAVAQTDETKPAPPAPAQMSDADRFFLRYGQAVQLVKHNRMQEALVLMDLLWRSLNSSPWMEIALLKHTELNERENDRVAMENYDLLRRRLANAPYYQGDAQKARLFRAAMQGAVERGIDRTRIHRIRRALSQYYARYQQYPESLARLSIFGYVEMEDIHTTSGRMFQYTPTGQRLTPFITYHLYEIETIAPEPFYVTSPRLEGTSLVSEDPKKYAALIRVAGRMDAQRVIEDQTLEGFLVAAVASGGAILCAPDRVLVLPVPE